MTAAELKFPDPPPGQPQWLALAQAVFNNQAARWGEECGGGIRWQFNPLNNGYNMKNTISNGCFFQLAARLARYTKNETYSYWADRTFDWMAYSELPVVSKFYEVFDSVTVEGNACTGPDHVQWSYNIGTLIAGSAYMYNHVRLASLEYE